MIGFERGRKKVGEGKIQINRARIVVIDSRR